MSNYDESVCLMGSQESRYVSALMFVSNFHNSAFFQGYEGISQFDLNTWYCESVYFLRSVCRDFVRHGIKFPHEGSPHEFIPHPSKPIVYVNWAFAWLYSAISGAQLSRCVSPWLQRWTSLTPPTGSWALAGPVASPTATACWFLMEIREI
jgi:hypothetical protein